MNHFRMNSFKTLALWIALSVSFLSIAVFRPAFHDYFHSHALSDVHSHNDASSDSKPCEEGQSCRIQNHVAFHPFSEIVFIHPIEGDFLTETFIRLPDIPTVSPLSFYSRAPPSFHC